MSVGQARSTLLFKVPSACEAAMVNSFNNEATAAANTQAALTVAASPWPTGSERTQDTLRLSQLGQKEIAPLWYYEPGACFTHKAAPCMPGCCACLKLEGLGRSSS